MALNKGVHSGSGGANRGRPWALMLLLAFGAAFLGIMVLHKLRERRIYNLLVKEKDRELLSLHLLLQKERDHVKELKRKSEEMKAKIYSLGSQKMGLDRRVLKMQSTMDSLKDEQKLMESAFEEKQNEIRMLQEKESYLGKENSQVIALKENLKQKEAEIEDLKHRLEVPVKSRWVSINDQTNLPENVSASGRMAAQDKTDETENKEKDEQLTDSTKYGKRTKNEDASKSKLTKFKDGKATIGVEHEIRDRLGNHDRLTETEEHIQRQETLQVEGTGGAGAASERTTDGNQKKKNEDDDDGERVTAKEIDVKIVDGQENKKIRERQTGQVEHNEGAGGQDFNVKQLADNSRISVGLKERHGDVSKTKGKGWRTIVKNRLMGSNQISEIHGEVNMNSRKVNRDEQDELKDRTEGRVSNDEKIEKVEKEEEEMDDNNPSKDRAEAKADAQNKIVSDTNPQLTESGISMHPRKQRLGEVRRLEKSGVQQSWSRRHINKVEKTAGQENIGTVHEEAEKLNAADVQQQEKDASADDDNEDNEDDFYKEPQADFEYEKEEYKEEIGEPEFKVGV